MNDDVFENVDKQVNLHREIGYLEGLSDAYRDMSVRRGADLHSLETELRALVLKLNPPF